MEIFDLITASVKERSKFLNFKISDLKSDMRITYLKVFEINFFNNRKRFHYKAEYHFSKIGLLYNESEGYKVYQKALPFFIFVVLMAFAAEIQFGKDAFGYTCIAGIVFSLIYLVRMAKIQRQLWFRNQTDDLAYELAYEINKSMKEGASRVEAMKHTYKRLMTGSFFHLYPYKQERQTYLNSFDLLSRIYFGHLRIEKLKGTMSDDELYEVAQKLERAIIKNHMTAFVLTEAEQRIVDDHKKAFIENHIEYSTNFYENHASIYEDRHYKPRYKKSLLQVLKLKSV